VAALKFGPHPPDWRGLPTPSVATERPERAAPPSNPRPHAHHLQLARHHLVRRVDRVDQLRLRQNVALVAVKGG